MVYKKKERQTTQETTQETKVLEGEIVETLRVKVIGFSEGRNTGYTEGFADGVRYIVTTAENNLAKALQLAERDALAKSDQIPPWWIITLVSAFGVKALPNDMAIKKPGEEESS